MADEPSAKEAGNGAGVGKLHARTLKFGRAFFFTVGLCGLILVLLGSWLDTAKLGGVLCAGALIGHMASWSIFSKHD